MDPNSITMQLSYTNSSLNDSVKISRDLDHWISSRKPSYQNHQPTSTVNRQHPFTSNTDILCLLQTAQVQRLSQVIKEQQCRQPSPNPRLDQLQTIRLDRHSYEVQIKELRDHLRQQKQRNENGAKLPFSFKTTQLQQLTNKYNEIQSKYSRAIECLNLIDLENASLRKQITTLKKQTQLQNNEHESQQREQPQLQEIAVLRVQNQQLKTNVKSLKNKQGQIDALREHNNKQHQQLMRKQQTIQKHIATIIQLQQQNAKLHHQHHELTIRWNNLLNRLQKADEEHQIILKSLETILLQQSHKFEGINQIKQLILQLKNEYNLKHQHIDRRTGEIESLLRGNRTLQQRLLKMNGQMRQKEYKINTLEQQLMKNQSSTTLHSSQQQEIQQLTATINQKNDQIFQFQGEITNLTDTIEEFHRKEQLLASQFHRLQTIINNLKQNNIKLKHENMEMNNKVKTLNIEIDQLKKISNELEGELEDCKLIMVDETSERKYQESMRMISLQSAEIQSLRVRLSEK